ncbi:MAG TPA: RNA methyltransferase [Trueperaceae bacterium]|nr:RNA methyltransferase [Trueperaceae bacterium]
MPGQRIVLVRAKESANVGAAARAMLNFGLDDLWLVAPRCRIDHRAYALASHAEEVLKSATVVDTLDEAIGDMTLVAGTSARERAADNYVVMGPREGAPRLAGSTAVLFGPEDHGLSNQELTKCQLQIVIPTADFSSLNLAQAVLVVAYELHMHGVAPVAQPSNAKASTAHAATDHAAPGSAPNAAAGTAAPAARDQVEGFYAQLERAMLHIGYTDPPRAPSIMRIYRALLDRARPNAHELAALRGLISQFEWAARQPPERLPGSAAPGVRGDDTDA